MIVPMRKYSFLIYHKEYEAFVDKLYELGVVQIIDKENASVINEKLENKIALLKQYSTAERFLQNVNKAEHADIHHKFTTYNKSLLEDFHSLKDKEDELNKQLLQINKDIDTLSPWGDSDNNTVNKLAACGYFVNYYTCSQRLFKESWKNDYNAIIVTTTNTNYYFITVTKDKKINIEAETVKIQEKPLIQLQQEEKDIKEQLLSISDQFVDFASNYSAKLTEEADNIRTDFDFSKVRINTEDIANEKVKLIEGWAPVPKTKDLENYLKENGILYTSREPDTKNDKIPILLKNNWFSKLFEPIGELYTLPEYGEIDLTPFFAPFYMLFFGLCLGDCGYGFIIAIAAFIIAGKAKPESKGIFKLAGWLGISTVIMGIVSGTFFGINLIDAPWPWLTNIKKIMLDSNQLFANSLILGAVQIIFGMFIKVFNQFKQKNISGGIVTIGWLLIILGAGLTYFLCSKEFISQQAAKLMYICFIVTGGICVFLLNNLNFNKKNIFGILNIGSGLWDTYNMATGLLGDLLSYIRLFALGISGSVMGFVFNNLAVNLSPDIIIVKQFVMILILLCGHAINIFMSALSAFVHPMRLTFVEFYKNSGFTGGGKKYAPFGKAIK